MRRVLFAAFLMLGLAGGCTRVPPKLTWEPADASFTGIRAALAAAPVRLFWVHGMCNHDRDWAVGRADELKRLLGLNYKMEEARTLAADKRLELYDAYFGDDDRLRATFVVWTPFTKPTKAILAADRSTSDPDAPGETPFKRATLNEKIKTVIFNECLADAVIYAGRQGDALRAVMPDALCDMLGGTPQIEQCRLPSGDGELGSLFLLSESLGSKILTDGLYNLWNSTKEGSADRETLARRLGKTETFFVLANQIPILNLAGAIVSGDRPFSVGSGTREESAPPTDGLAVISAARARTGRGTQLPIVSFYDPNDLLSYRLSPAYLPDDVRDKVQITNGAVSNTPIYLGIASRPDQAHLGYKDQPEVISAIVGGR